jgi:hypothetical protein
VEVVVEVVPEKFTAVVVVVEVFGVTVNPVIPRYTTRIIRWVEEDYHF